jgi:hypothetical protein
MVRRFTPTGQPPGGRREGGKVQNVHLGRCRKLSSADAIQRARKMKADALGLHHQE